MKKRDYKKYKNCRFCNTPTVKVIDLGRLPLAGGFLNKRSDFKNEKKYQLELMFCKNCFLVQTSIAINADTLFKRYFYFSSSIKTLTNHFQDNAEYFSRFFKEKNKFIVEIGSNDGTFLNYMHKKGFRTLGVDPAKNVVEKVVNKKLDIVNDYFDEKLAKKIFSKKGGADLIFSSNTLAHIENIRSVFKGISKLLKDDGILVFEVHYLLDLVKNMQYDMIYHEHQYYYSLLSLQKNLENFDLYIYDAKKNPIHGGSIQVFASKRKKNKTLRLEKLLELEKEHEISKLKTFKRFNKQIGSSKKELKSMIKKIKSENKSIVGYGASGRGTTVLNYCELDSGLIDAVIDDAPAKINAFMPGTHQIIVSSEMLNKKIKPDYVLLFAWAFFDEISKKNKIFVNSGGKFIYPLPKVRILNP